MGSTTGTGLPYPLGTDKVVDGDNAIRALAEAVDARWLVQASGATTLTTTMAVMNLTPVINVGNAIAGNAITVPYTGWYFLNGRISQTGVTPITAAVKNQNGTLIAQVAASGASGAAAAPVISALLRLNAGDKITVSAAAASGTISSTWYYPYLTMMIMRGA